jgi:DNA mismatch repair protein MutS2
LISKKTAQTLEYDLILKMLGEKTVSESGRALALGLMPTGDPAAAERLMEETREAETLLIKHTAHPVSSFDEPAGELRRLATGASLNCAELLRLNTVFKAAMRTKKAVAGETGGYLSAMAKKLFFEEHVMREIDECIIGENDLADTASDELFSIRRKIRRENEFIREKLQSIIKSGELSKQLQDAIVTQRNGRYVVPVKAEYKGKLPGIVHAQSASGATLFIEPMSVVEANNRISELASREEEEVARILARLSDEVRPHIGDIETNVVLLATLDLVFAKASLGLSMKAVPVEFGGDHGIRIKDGRHPLILEDQVIPLSVSTNEQVHSLMITGPNTGGKTVTLKMVGLFALMAQSGMYLPAHIGVKMPIFDGVFADIGDEQSIEQSLSTFSSHMKNIIYILKHAGKKSLVLLDEVGAGTEPQEGGAIAMAVLTALSSQGSTILATTHYSELKAFAMRTAGFENASMEFDPVALRPTYRLLIGVAGQSNAMLVAKRLGLPGTILSAAQGFLASEHTAMNDLLENAEKTRQQAQGELLKAQKMMEEAARTKREAAAHEQRQEEKYHKILEDARSKALEIVSEAKDESEEMIKAAKKLKKMDESGRTRETQKIRRTLDSRKEVLAASLHKTKRKGAHLRAADLKLGDSVHIVSMDADGTVIGLPNAKGQVRVQAGIMRIDIHISDLEAPEKEREKKYQRTSSVNLAQRSVGLSIDLHGQAVDNAQLLLDKYLDDAFLSGLSEVTVIHGRGTGVLKNGVRRYLKTHPHVKSFRSGEYGEGGDGVTVVALK